MGSNQEKDVNDIIKYVTSSNLEQLEKYIKDKTPIIPQFPLCGRWRKNITLLHIASAYGSLTSMEFLLTKCDINSLTDDKWTPIHCAAANSHPSAVEFLIENGANIHLKNSELLSPLHVAASTGNSEIIMTLIEAGADPNERTSLGWNAVHYGALTKLSSVFDPLLVAGADINAVGINGESPLHIAAKYGSERIISALIKYGAFVNIQDKSGSTPLHYAISQSHFNAAKILLRAGADPKIRNNGGQAPIDTTPLALTNQTKLFFEHWEQWDELAEVIDLQMEPIS